MIIFHLILGFSFLYIGASLALKGAVKLALNLRVSKLLIGLTIVAFGTSLPEGCVSIVAAFQGNAHLALGNIMGSNIANIGLALGAAALVAPLNTGNSFSSNELRFVAFSGVILFFMMINAHLSRIEGIVLLALFGVFVYLLFHDEQSRKSAEEEVGKDNKPALHRIKYLIYVVIGIVLLVGGAHYFVKGAIGCAHYFNVPEWIIGITLVAVGTSIPELATSIVAARKGEATLIVGNILGSNTMNFYLILALAVIIKPITVEDPYFIWQLCFFVFFSILPVPMLLFGKNISRFKGFLMLSAYCLYIVWVKNVLM
ncbi:calcium/sodium antiporter [Candidatus Omnitrophota bacterium]